MASSFRGIFSVALGVRDVLEGCIYAINIIIRWVPLVTIYSVCFIHRNGKIRNKVFLSFILNGFVLAVSAEGIDYYCYVIVKCIII